MLRSMTGFSRETTATEIGQLSLEIRSVNHRYLDPTFKMPELLRALEPELREMLQKNVSRGKVEVGIRIDFDEAESAHLTFNEATAKELLAIHAEANALLGASSQLSALQLMQLPGVMKSSTLNADSIKAPLFSLFTQALKSFLDNREREGARLKEMMLDRLDQMEALVEKAREQRPIAVAKIEERLRGRLENLDIEHDPQRFEQELIYVTQRLDIDEEIDRLTAHIAEMKHVFSRKEPVGRRLDFLTQELNREANTLGSKSQDVVLTQIGVDLKVLIEQIREQIQNIE
ncbi:YicC/YloC family endoribonuclease [Ignatzschineria sp. LJL83]